MYWIIVTLSILSYIIWKFYWQPYCYWKNMGVPQTSPKIFLGDGWPTLFRIKNLMEWMNWLYYMYPKSKYLGMYQFYLPILLLKDPELIKQIAVKDFDFFTDHNNFAVDEEVDPLWSKNLFSLKGQKWRDMRSLLSRSFTSSKMKLFYGLIAEESQKFVNYFMNQHTDFIDVELKDQFIRYTNDVIASISFGIKVDSLENPENDFFVMGKEVSDFSGIIVFLKLIGVTACPWLLKLFKIGFISKRVRTFFTSIIDETIKAREEQGIVRPDMLNLMIEFRKGVQRTYEKDVLDTGFAVVKETTELVTPTKRKIEISNMDIASQALLFFLGGSDTIATSICYACYELALNPEIQNKLRKEIKTTFDRTDGKPTYEDILGMKYLDMVITESLRKWPIAPSVDRVCVKPYALEPTSPGEPTVTFKKSDTIWIPIFNIHHDPQYYPDPEKFIPERFSDENKGNIKPYTYMPFGIGPRACIGSRFALLDIKAILFHLLNSFEIVTTDKTPIPLVLSKSAVNFTPINGFPLGMKRI